MILLPFAEIRAEHLALMIPIFALSIPIVAIISSHLQRIAKIKAEAGSNLSQALREELDAIKREIVALRDTSTKFDMSFDAALTSLEQRMERVESKQAESAYPAVPAQPEASSATLQQGR